MAHLLLVLTTLFWSGNFVLARAMHLDMPPLSLAFFRWGGALLLLLPWVLPGLWNERHLLSQHWKILLLFSVLGVANFNSFIYLGLQHTTATNATLLQSAIPIVILLLSASLGQRIGRVQGLGILTSLLGVVLIVTRGELQWILTLRLNPGDLWILAAVLSWSLYSVALRWRPQGVSPLSLLGATVLVGVVLLFPFYLWERHSGATIEWGHKPLMVVGYMALFPSVLAYFFWNHGVAALGAARAGLYIHLMPVFGLLLSVIFLTERVFAFHLFGITLIFAGIYLAIGRQSRNLELDGDVKRNDRNL